MRTLVACLVLAAAARAQDTAAGPRPQIQGVVVEYGTNRGLAGAEIVVTGEGTESQLPPQTTASDSQGAFHVDLDKFGRYRLKVKMEGYKPVTDSTSGLPPLFGSFEAPVGVTRANPKQNLRFVLVQPAELTGRVVDDETGKPIARVPVAAVAAGYLNGRRTLRVSARAVTDEDGQFVFAGLLPGNFLVETLPRVLGPQQFQTQFSADDLKTVDQDYERTYWPGGQDGDSASPIAIGSGGSVNIGTLKSRKTSYYKVHAIFPAANCSAGQSVDVRFEPAAAGQGIEAANSQVSCGQDFLVRSLQPGSYRLTLLSGRTPDTRVQGSVPVEVTDRNLDVTVSVARGMNLDGTIVAADGARQPPASLLVFVQPADLRIAAGPPLRPDSQGAFHVVNAPLGRQRITLGNMGNFYVKEIRYNGLSVPDGNFNLDGSPGRLEVVVDDKPAAVGGVVADEGNPVSKPYVVLAVWPSSPDSLYSSLKNTTGDDSGKFRFSGLPPGDYKVLAVPQALKEKLDEPGVLDRLLSGAEKVTLGPSAFENLQLKPSDPLH